MKLQVAQLVPLVFTRQSQAQASLSSVLQGTNALVPPNQRHVQPAFIVLTTHVLSAKRGNIPSLPRRLVFPVPKVTSALLKINFPLSAMEQLTNQMLVKQIVKSVQPAFAVIAP